MKLSYLHIPAIAIFTVFGLSVSAQEENSKSYRFPGGDPEEGRTAFINLNCIQCHTASEVVTPEPKAERRLHLELGKESRFVTSYQDIITAITNPKHVVQKQYQAILSEAQKAGEIEALMPNLTEDMSARQLMDLTAFLDRVYAQSLDEYKK